MTHPLCLMAVNGRVSSSPLSAPLSTHDTRTGVYCVWMPADAEHRVYVGQTGRRVTRRISAHRVELRQGKHHSGHLQRAYNKYGEDAFVWALVEELPADTQVLTPAEQAWMDLAGRERLFNTAPAAGSTLGLVKSPEQLAKNKAYWDGLSPEERSAHMRRAKAAMTPEARSAAARKVHERMSDETRAVMAAKRNATVAVRHGGWHEIVLAREAAKTPEQRRASALKREAAVTPEEYAARTAKAWATRRANAAARLAVAQA